MVASAGSAVVEGAEMPSKVYCSTLAFVPTVGILSSFSSPEQPKKEAASAKARSRGITFHPFFFIKMTILSFHTAISVWEFNRAEC